MVGIFELARNIIKWTNSNYNKKACVLKKTVNKVNQILKFINLKQTVSILEITLFTSQVTLKAEGHQGCHLLLQQVCYHWTLMA